MLCGAEQNFCQLADISGKRNEIRGSGSLRPRSAPLPAPERRAPRVQPSPPGARTPTRSGAVAPGSARNTRRRFSTSGSVRTVTDRAAQCLDRGRLWRQLLAAALEGICLKGEHFFLEMLSRDLGALSSVRPLLLVRCVQNRVRRGQCPVTNPLEGQKHSCVRYRVTNADAAGWALVSTEFRVAAGARRPCLESLGTLMLCVRIMHLQDENMHVETGSCFPQGFCGKAIIPTLGNSFLPPKDSPSPWLPLRHLGSTQRQRQARPMPGCS